MLTNSAFLNFFIWLLFIAAFIEVLTLIHELGHFIVAKMNKVRVAEFAIGFGPVMFQWGKKETKYSIRWFPFGGYVSVLNEDVQNTILKMRDSNLNPMQWEMAAKQIRPFDPKDDSVLTSKPIDKVSWLGKFSFALMGVTFNFIFMFSAIWIFAGSMGTPTQDNSSFYVIHEVTPTSTSIVEIADTDNSDGDAYNDTFQYSTDGLVDTEEDINTHNEAYELMTTADTGDIVKIEYWIDGGYNYRIQLEYIDNPNTTSNDEGWVVNKTQTSNEYYKNLNALVYDDATYGATINVDSFLISRYTLEYTSSSFVEAWEDTAVALTNAVLFTFTFGIVQLESEMPEGEYFDVTQAEKWVMFCFDIFIILSAIMIIFNLLPVPPLDGWKASQWTYEEITGKRMDPIKEAKINKIGWTIVIGYSLLFLFVPLIPGVTI